MPPPPANAKAAYATMVYVRATIVEDAGWVLARATTIAVRHLPTCFLTKALWKTACLCSTCAFRAFCKLTRAACQAFPSSSHCHSHNDSCSYIPCACSSVWRCRARMLHGQPVPKRMLMHSQSWPAWHPCCTYQPQTLQQPATDQLLLKTLYMLPLTCCLHSISHCVFGFAVVALVAVICQARQLLADCASQRNHGCPHRLTCPQCNGQSCLCAAARFSQPVLACIK